MRLILSLFGVFWLADSAPNRWSLLPKSMRAKMCELDSNLRICQKQASPPLPILRDALSYSRWSICDARPFLRLCRYRPGTFDEFADAQRIMHEQSSRQIQIIHDPRDSFENRIERSSENPLIATSPPFLIEPKVFDS